MGDARERLTISDPARGTQRLQPRRPRRFGRAHRQPVLVSPSCLFQEKYRPTRPQ